MNLAVIGVSADPPKKQKKFSDKYDFNYPLLCDESHSMLESYGVWGLKKFMGREYEGIIRKTFVIENNKIVKLFEKVKTNDHAKQILEAMN